MPGGAAAAIGGARRGIEKGKREARITREKKFAEMRREAKERYKKEAEKVSQLMEQYDKDKSGYLEPDDIKTILADYRFHLKGKAADAPPSADEIDSLLVLCDVDGNGKISSSELMDTLKTWYAYIEKGEETLALLQKYDVDKTGDISHMELKPLVIELNEGEDVPEDVMKWIWDQADLNADGALDQFQLTRAIAAWYVWLPDEQDEETGGMAAKMDKQHMPEAEVKTPKASCLCVLQ